MSAVDGQDLCPVLAQAAALLAAVTSQDLEESASGGVLYRPAGRRRPEHPGGRPRGTARSQDPARGSGGYKAHVSIDPDSELVTATAVTPGNGGRRGGGPPAGRRAGAIRAGEPADGQAGAGNSDEPSAVSGDAAYGVGELLATLEQGGAGIYCKVQPPVAPAGRFTKDAFRIDLAAGQVSCPAGQTTPPRQADEGRIFLRQDLRRLPPGRAVHHRQERPQHLRRPVRGAACPGSRQPGRPGLDGGLRRPGPRWNARSDT